MRNSLVTIALWLVLYMGTAFVSGQENDLIDIPITVDGGLMLWSSDSRTVTIRGRVIELQEISWVTVEVANQNVSVSDTFSLGVSLNTEELDFFSLSEVVRFSPDEQLILYTEAIEDNTSTNESPESYALNYQFVIANRATREIYHTGILTEDMTVDTLQVGPIIWSENSHALAIETWGIAGDAKVFHISIPDANNLQTIMITEFRAVIGNELYYIPDALRGGLAAIDASGERVLVYANRLEESADIYEERSFLIDWKPRQPGQTMNIRSETDDRTGSPRFISSSENELFYWKSEAPFEANNGALYRYNLETDVETLLWQPSSEVIPISFSPNGDWGVFIDNEIQVYLLDIGSLLETISPANAVSD